MRNLIIGVVSGLMMLGTVSAMAAEPVGVVDYQKLGQLISFQDLFKTRMETATSASRQDIETLTKAMQEKQKQLDDKTAKLSDAQKKELQSTVDQQKQKLTQMQTESQKKVMEIRTNLGNELKQKLEEVMGQVAAKHNLSVVLVSASVAYASNKVDVTDEVASDLSKALGVKLVSPSDQKPAMMQRPMMGRTPSAQ
ncbi:MAG: OmpH family outer membrane protein [Candidatus Berkiella sp.]